MNVETRMSFEPPANLGMLVRRVVVSDDAKFFALRRGVVDEPEELDPPLVPMTLLTEADHLAAGRVQGRKQGGCAMAFVIVGHCASPGQ